MTDENRWLNSADIKNWYIESYPDVNLTDKRFSMMDIFHNINKIPGAKMVFRSTFILESEEEKENK